MTPPHTIVFDVNETLSDLSPLGTRFEEVGAPAALAKVWFASTLRDGFALTIAGPARPFADVARAVLSTLWRSVPDLNRPADDATDYILDAFVHLDVHPDVAEGVRALNAAGFRLVTLTNGATSVGEALLDRAGLSDAFAMFLSVQDVGRWKPHAAAYRYGAERCAADPADLMLVAVHPWDIDGAHRAGLRTAYLDRADAGYPAIFSAPDLTVPDLTRLPAALTGTA